MKDIKRPLFAVLALLAAGLLALALTSRGPGLAVGSPAPDFVLPGTHGRSVSLGDYRGRVVLLDFWATWCDTCQVELPDLIALYRKQRRKPFEILAVSVDEAGIEDVAAFATAAGLPYPVLMADYPTAQSYNVSGIPLKLLIDQNGIIYKKYTGEADPAELEADIETLLKRSPGGTS
ncbi:MAG: TlpA family protein disulfide reductase [Elusimicrobia bacterium]|nr:TlpA family protein disulfide reductase [Elusimicrobiota bacterium]